MMPNPRTAAEWVQWIREQSTVEQAVQVLDAYARQQVEAALERAAQHLENASYLAQSEYVHNVLKSHATAIRALKP